MLIFSHLTVSAALVAGLALGPFAPGAAAQSLAQRVAAARDGTLHLRFAAAPGACGDGGAVIGRRTADGALALFAAELGNLPRDVAAACRPGPVEVALRVAGGRVESVRSAAGPGGRSDALQVSAAEAAPLLLGVAMRAEGETARAALVPVFLLEGEAVWRGILGVARGARGGDARKMASQELGRRAAASIPGGGRGHQADLELSKENGSEADWLATATRDRDPARRRAALQLLGKDGSPRALDLFESILSGRVR